MFARINPCFDLGQIPHDFATAERNATGEFPLLFEVVDRALAQRDHCQQLFLADENFAQFP